MRGIWGERLLGAARRPPWAAQLVAATLGAAVAAWILPEVRYLIAGLWVLVLLIAALATAVARTHRIVARPPSVLDTALTTVDQRPPRPADLVRCERIFGWGSYSAKDFDDTARPALRALIGARLEPGPEASGPEPRPGADGPDNELKALLGRTSAEKLYGRWVTSEDLDRIVSAMERL